MVSEQTSKERQAYWVGVINEARAYPDGVTAYCRKYNISKPVYYMWFRRLKDRHEGWKAAVSQKKRKKRSGAGVTKGETEVQSKETRRTFSREEKLRILEAVDAAPDGEKGAVLRQEGIYSSHIQKWRKELASHEPVKRGPKPDPQAKIIKQLEAKLARSQKELTQARQIIEIQKKVSELWGIALEPIQQDED